MTLHMLHTSTTFDVRVACHLKIVMFFSERYAGLSVFSLCIFGV